METQDINPPKQINQVLGEQSNLINYEPEEYILTKEEEDSVLSHERKRLAEHMVWKMKGIAMTDFQISEKLKTIDFDSVIDKNKVLQYANSCKHQRLWEESRRKCEKLETAERYKQLKSDWSAQRMYKHLASNFFTRNNKSLIVNTNTLYLIKVLCYFLSRDEKFESELKFSLKKGLLIRGVSGVGKTEMIKCLSNNELNPICLVSMIEVSEQIQQDGEYQIKMGDCNILALDDVGTEEAFVKHYGTTINYFKNFIETTYFKNRSFENLIITTNNNFDELENKYGFRVRSRMRDMFNVVDVVGTDLRGI